VCPPLHPPQTTAQQQQKSNNNKIRTSKGFSQFFIPFALV
jgi:hypothetical protein